MHNLNQNQDANTDQTKVETQPCAVKSVLDTSEILQHQIPRRLWREALL